MIKPVKREQLPIYLHILRESYEQTAVTFGMTEENCPYRGRTRLPLAVLEQEWEDGALMFGSLCEGKAVGFLSMQPKGDVLYIQDIAVLPGYQNRGHGGELFAFAVETAQNAGAGKISLGMVYDSIRLREWYQSLGFTVSELLHFEKVSYTVAILERKTQWQGEHPMKKEFDCCPQAIDESRLYGFSWMEHVAAVPSPLVLVTGYKSNGLPNATMQSWCTFVGEEGYHCLFSSVHKQGHMYQSLKETGCCVVNFPSKDCFLKCMDTIQNNGFNQDELALSGLTAEPASKVNAPRVRECFLNLECELEWERDLSPEGVHAVMCLRVVNVCMDREHYDEHALGRYGETGYLYNIHSPRNPETGEVTATHAGTLTKYATYDQLPKG